MGWAMVPGGGFYFLVEAGTALSSARPLFHPAAWGVRTANDVEPVKCVHLCIQGVGSHPTI